LSYSRNVVDNKATLTHRQSVSAAAAGPRLCPAQRDQPQHSISAETERFSGL